MEGPILSDKKKSKRKIEDVMREFNDLLEHAIILFDEGIDLLCDGKQAEFDKKVAEIIQDEKKADRLKDELVQLFMERETMAFSRSDRLELLEVMDTVFDKIEYCVRMVEAHPMDPYTREPAAKHLQQFSHDIEEIVKALVGAVNMAEDDLQKTIEATRLIEELRRHARDHSFNVIEDILQGDYTDLEKMLLSTTTEYMIDIMDTAEEAGDFLRKIAIKYLVLA